MLSLSQLQSFIGEVSNMVNSKDNPLGLSPGQIDEINQIMNIVKNLISDGIQRGDISKLIHLMGEMAEHMPELKDEIKEIVQDLKALGKKLFNDDDNNFMKDPMKVNNLTKNGLGMQSDLLMNQDLGEQGFIPEDALGEGVDQQLLEDTFNQRTTIAEKILNMLNNHTVLTSENFGAIEGLLKKVNLRAGLGPIGAKHSPKTSDGATENISSDQRVNLINPTTQSNQSDSFDSFGQNNSTFSSGA